MLRRPIVIAALALAAGLLLGFVLGRWTLLREWSQPEVLIEPGDAARSAAGDADPTPRAGTRVLRPMPLARTRVALAGISARDPVVVTVGAVGRDDDAMELHLTLRNRGRCEVTSVAGVAYGFDAWGRPAKMNRAGEHYVAFASTEQRIAPGEVSQAAWPLRHPENASLVVAHVDRVRCADGTEWARR